MYTIFWCYRFWAWNFTAVYFKYIHNWPSCTPGWGKLLNLTAFSKDMQQFLTNLVGNVMWIFVFPVVINAHFVYHIDNLGSILSHQHCRQYTLSITLTFQAVHYHIGIVGSSSSTWHHIHVHKQAGESNQNLLKYPNTRMVCLALALVRIHMPLTCGNCI